MGDRRGEKKEAKAFGKIPEIEKTKHTSEENI